MLVYLSVFLIILLLVLSNKNKTISPYKNLVVPFLLIFAMMALRVDWGGDYEAYEEMFPRYHYGSIVDALETGMIESGFRVLMVLCDSYRTLIVVTSLIICIGLFLFFSKLPKEYLVLAFFLLFLDKSMLPGEISGIRNGIAVAVFLIGLLFLQRGQRVIYLLLLLLAFYFHRSAIFMTILVLIPQRQIKVNPMIIMGAFLLYVIIAASMTGSIAQEIDSFVNTTDEFERYEGYAERSLNEQYSVSLFYLPAVPMLVFIVLAMQTKGLSKTDYFYLNAALIWGILLFFPPIAFKSRFHFYVDFLLLGGSVVLCQKVPKYKAPYLACLIVFYIADFIRYATSLHYLQHWFHYHSIIGL